MGLFYIFLTIIDVTIINKLFLKKNLNELFIIISRGGGTINSEVLYK